MGESEEDPQKQKILEAKAAETQLKAALRSALDETAYDRMMNVAHSNKERYIAAVRQVLAVSQRVGRKITDAELLRILLALQERTDNETKITFHKK